MHAKKNINQRILVDQLFTAVQCGDIKQTKLLIRHGVDVNARRREGFTPLHIATGEGKLEVVKVLLSAGAQPNAKCRSTDGGTPLHTACAWNRSRIARVLVEQGSDITVKDKKKKTPVYFARLYGHKRLADYLVRTQERSSKNTMGREITHQSCE